LTAFLFSGLSRGSQAQVSGWPVSYSSYLLSWVPTELVPLVEEAIDVNPEGCLMWANLLDIPLITALRTAGLLI